jgi:hypothetical protein
MNSKNGSCSCGGALSEVWGVKVSSPTGRNLFGSVPARS